MNSACAAPRVSPSAASTSEFSRVNSSCSRESYPTVCDVKTPPSCATLIGGRPYRLAPQKITSPSSTTESTWRSEEHTSELQSLTNLVCRLLLEKKKKKKNIKTK